MKTTSYASISQSYWKNSSSDTETFGVWWESSCLFKANCHTAQKEIKEVIKERFFMSLFFLARSWINLNYAIINFPPHYYRP